MSKTEYLIWQCDTSLTSWTTLLAIMKYMSRTKSTAVNDIDSDIGKRRYRQRRVFCSRVRKQE